MKHARYEWDDHKSRRIESRRPCSGFRHGQRSDIASDNFQSAASKSHIVEAQLAEG